MTNNERNIRYKLRYYQSTLEPNVEMAISIEDQQRIFLAYRALFEGQNAQVRQKKTITKVLKSNKNWSSPLVQSFGFEKVVSVVKILLEKNIFSSELKAKLAFPLLYETSPEQDARHEASDVGAAKEEAEALQEVEVLDNAAVEEADAEVFDFEDDSLGGEGKLPAAVENLNGAELDNQETKLKPNIDVPSLYPVQFPFRLQYLILARTQKLLEECCYDFTLKYAPNLLTDKKWDCAEAIELNKWTLTIIKRYGKLPAGAFKKPDSNFHHVLLAVNKLRHSAVHRLRISAKGIVQMIDAAVKFAENLSDSVRASQLEELYNELKSKIKSQELNKNYLETKLQDKLNEIKRQREELVEQEREAISTLVTEDRDNMHFVGSLLESNLRNILGGDNVDDDFSGSDLNVQIKNTKAEATDEDACEDDLLKYSELPKSASNGTEGVVENEGVEFLTEDVKGDSSKERNSAGFGYAKFSFPKHMAFDWKSIQSTNTSREPRECENYLAEKPPLEEASFAEPRAPEPQLELAVNKNKASSSPISEEHAEERGYGESATEVQPKPTANENELSFSPLSEKHAEECDFRESATEIQPKIQSPAVEPRELLSQYDSIADAIQDILKGHAIDPSYIRKLKGNGKKQKKSMTKIKGVISENLRRGFENGIFEDLILTQTEHFFRKK